MKKFMPNKIISSLIYLDFSLATALGLLSPVMAVYITEHVKGGDLQTVGFATSAFYLTKSLFQLFVARYIDRRKDPQKMAVMFVGTSIMAAVPFLYFFASAVWHIYLFEVLAGVGAALFVPAWYALFTKNVDSNNISFEWSLDSVMIGISEVIAGALSGVMAQHYGFRALFVTAGTVGFITGVLPSLYLMYTSLKPKLGKKQHEEVKTFPEKIKEQVGILEGQSETATGAGA